MTFDLRAARARLGMTQEELGKALGYKGPNVRKIMSDYEKGDPAFPAARQQQVERMLDRLAERIGEAAEEAMERELPGGKVLNYVEIGREILDAIIKWKP